MQALEYGFISTNDSDAPSPPRLISNNKFWRPVFNKFLAFNRSTVWKRVHLAGLTD